MLFHCLLPPGKKSWLSSQNYLCLHCSSPGRACSCLAWETGRGAGKHESSTKPRSLSRRPNDSWGVLNNNLFQVPGRSSQINFPSPSALYLFSADRVHLWRQVTVKVLQPTAVYWINGLSTLQTYMVAHTCIAFFTYTCNFALKLPSPRCFKCE